MPGADQVKELVVISGKGGTGKTSIVASFACLAEKAVLADCDVDAADLHLVLEPKKQLTAMVFRDWGKQVLHRKGPSFATPSTTSWRLRGRL